MMYITRYTGYMKSDMYDVYDYIWYMMHIIEYTGYMKSDMYDVHKTYVTKHIHDIYDTNETYNIRYMINMMYTISDICYLWNILY